MDSLCIPQTLDDAKKTSMNVCNEYKKKNFELTYIVERKNDKNNNRVGTILDDAKKTSMNVCNPYNKKKN